MMQKSNIPVEVSFRFDSLESRGDPRFRLRLVSDDDRRAVGQHPEHIGSILR